MLLMSPWFGIPGGYTDVTGMILQVKDNLPLPHLARRKDSELDVPRRLGHLANRKSSNRQKRAGSKRKSENLNFYLNVFFFLDFCF